MSKNRHGGKKRQKQRRHFRRQVDIAYIAAAAAAGEGGIAICHIALCTAHICVHPSHLRRLRAQVKHVMIAVLSSRSLNNLLPSSPWVRGPLTKQCLASALRPIVNYQSATSTEGGGNQKWALNDLQQISSKNTLVGLLVRCITWAFLSNQVV